jgi:hypothetical protein
MLNINELLVGKQVGTIMAPLILNVNINRAKNDKRYFFTRRHTNPAQK